MAGRPVGDEGPPVKISAAKKRKLRFIAAEREQESGGDYQIVNNTSGALGAWQVMPANLPGWLAASGLPPMTPDQYLHNDKAQNRLAWVILGGYYDKYGPAGAAAMWYSGQPDPNKNYGKPTVRQYVNDVLTLMGENPGINNLGIAQAATNAFGPPPPNEGDWSDIVREAGLSHTRAAGTLLAHTRAITALTGR